MAYKKVDALNAVDQDRRGFFKTLALGSAVAVAVPLMTSAAVAQDSGDAGDGKGKGKGKGDDAGGGFDDGPNLAFQGGSVLGGTDPQGAMGTLRDIANKDLGHCFTSY